MAAGRRRTLRILDFVHGGEGLARSPGHPVTLVPGVVPGDLALVEIEGGARGYERARLVSIIEPGPGRRPAPCVHAERCGGCSWLHVEDAVQAEAVRGLLLAALRRVGRLRVEDDVVAAPLTLPSGLAYRQRVRLHLDLAASPPRSGFMGAGSHDVAVVDSCAVLEPALEAVRRSVAETLHDLRRALGPVRAQLQVDLPAPRSGAAQLSISPDDAVTPEGAAMALTILRHGAPELVALDVRHRGRVVARSGEDAVRYLRGTLEEPERWPAYLAPGGFLQAGREGNRLLVSRVVAAVARLGLARGARALEVFAGNGNLSFPAAALGLDLLATDSDDAAIANAQRALEELEDRPCLRFEARDARRSVRDAARAGRRPDLVLLDPPRTGARDVMGALADLAPDHVVYASCDAATLARDAAILVGAGWTLETAEPLVLFPQTAHFETVATFTRRGG